MSHIIKFVRPEQEIPAWILSYEPETHAAPVDLRDLQFLVDRVNREHVVTVAWASNAGGKLHVEVAGKGMSCRHRVDIEAEDSFSAILDRINNAVVAHVDCCLGRARGKQQQATLFG
jgi:hypothetical protein